MKQQKKKKKKKRFSEEACNKTAVKLNEKTVFLKALHLCWFPFAPFRYIVLDNGLQALLISDYSGPAASEDDDSDAEDEEEEEEDESGDETEDESEEDDDIEEGSDEDDDEGKKKKGNAEKQVLSDQYHDYQYHQMYPFCPLSD